MRTLNLRLISIGLYFVSLWVPIFFGSDSLGINALVLGWIGLFSGDLFIGLAWLANPFYFANIALYRKPTKIKLILSIATLTLGLFAIGIKQVLVHEGGLIEQVTPGIGFGIWILSFLTLLIGQLLDLPRHGATNHQ